MGTPIFPRLDEAVRAELDLAAAAADEARRSRIRQASAAIGERVATSTAARAFYQQWGFAEECRRQGDIITAAQTAETRAEDEAWFIASTEGWSDDA